MNKKFTLVLVLVFIYINLISAQNQREQVEFHSEIIGVYLDDGSVIIGKLIDETKRELQLLMPGGDNLVLQRKDVNKVKRTSEDYSFTSNGRYNYNKGFYCTWYPLALFLRRTSRGLSSGGNWNGTQFQVGRHHNPRLSYGLMAGTLQVNNYHEETDFGYLFTAAPIAALVNYNINLKGPRIYITSKLGHALKIDRGWFKDVNIGMYGSIGLGVVMPTRSLSRFTIEIERTFIKNYGLTSKTYFWQEEVIPEPFSTFAKYLTIKLGIALRQ